MTTAGGSGPEADVEGYNRHGRAGSSARNRGRQEARRTPARGGGRDFWQLYVFCQASDAVLGHVLARNPGNCWPLSQSVRRGAFETAHGLFFCFEFRPMCRN
ncbi:MAG: hypothetical protein BJ554DRAFT_6255 [Olpidium bornovanus]|uniref:Uncharacterized protein n=1 Tax=Olpidium bornovanus TaxID=278681 RepID=A0A8H7ZY06_9FUNG|nr:MAG: hypothetical protein BJ554DRAFT_6255 [Olpidium bornovanus]